ncbi:MAG: hypothetical protein M3Q97_10895, partial [Bacteroidota bacterium]|nr:hypothetical protein [Bacteroidota bacterium]
SQNFNLRIGYNHQRRKEMTIENNRGAVGYSFGVGLRVSKFHLSYGRSVYHLAAASNTFTITTDLSQIFGMGKAGNWGKDDGN